MILEGGMSANTAPAALGAAPVQETRMIGTIPLMPLADTARANTAPAALGAAPVQIQQADMDDEFNVNFDMNFDFEPSPPPSPPINAAALATIPRRRGPGSHQVLLKKLIERYGESRAAQIAGYKSVKGMREVVEYRKHDWMGHAERASHMVSGLLAGARIQGDININFNVNMAQNHMINNSPVLPPPTHE